MLKSSLCIPRLCILLLLLFVVSPGQALRFDPIPTGRSIHTISFEKPDVRVPSVRKQKQDKADRKKRERKIKRFFKRVRQAQKKTQNKAGFYLAFMLVGYILFGLIAIWLTLSIFAAINGSIVWFIVLAFALGLLALAIWATVKRKEYIDSTPNFFRDKERERQEKFGLDNDTDVDERIYAELAAIRKKTKIFFGLWLGTLLAVILCLAIGLPSLFSTFGAIFIMIALLLTPANITFFILYLANASRRRR